MSPVPFKLDRKPASTAQDYFTYLLATSIGIALIFNSLSALPELQSPCGKPESTHINNIQMVGFDASLQVVPDAFSGCGGDIECDFAACSLFSVFDNVSIVGMGYVNSKAESCTGVMESIVPRAFKYTNVEWMVVHLYTFSVCVALATWVLSFTSCCNTKLALLQRTRMQLLTNTLQFFAACIVTTQRSINAWAHLWTSTTAQLISNSLYQVVGVMLACYWLCVCAATYRHHSEIDCAIDEEVTTRDELVGQLVDETEMVEVLATNVDVDGYLPLRAQYE